MRGRRAWWGTTVRIVGAKLAIALALAVSDRRQLPADYWLLDTTTELEVGAPVAMSGVVVGQVVASKQRGDTTFLRVRFTSEMSRLPRSQILWLQRVGMEGLVALEMASAQSGDRESVERGGRLRVIFETPSTDQRALGRDLSPSDETSPPFLWRPKPPGSPASLHIPLPST
jgi:hypothetical protein